MRRQVKWVGGAFVFSGRPNPTWSVRPSVAENLQRIWNALAPAEKQPTPGIGLGYRGCFLRGPGGREWFAFEEAASLRSPAGVEVRYDVNRGFEQALLASAPKGLLPEALPQSEWRSSGLKR